MVCFTQGHEHTKPACLPCFILAWKQFRAGTMGRSGAHTTGTQPKPVPLVVACNPHVKI